MWFSGDVAALAVVVMDDDDEYEVVQCDLSSLFQPRDMKKIGLE